MTIVLISAALLFVFIAQFLFGGRLSAILRYAFWLAVVIILGGAFYSAFAQYRGWAAGELTQFLLPPHQNINYFLVDVGKKIFAPPFIALLAALIILRLAERLNKRYGERFFYGEEFGLMRLGIFLTGYPGFLFYLILVLAASVFLSWLFTLLSYGRAPMRWFWMPAAIVTVVLLAKALPPEILGKFAL